MTAPLPRLDWVSQHDPRSRDYPVRALLGASQPRARRRRLWTPGTVTDQGVEGQCVGHGWTGELGASPVRVNLSRARLPEGWPTEPQGFAGRLYHEAQKVDEWPGEEPVYAGTSVLAGAQVLSGLGLVREYRWCFGRDDLADTLSAKGPVVIGMQWLAAMYSAPDGILRPGGAVVGGHCILATGYDPAHPILGEAVRLTNSWGQSWGDQGNAWVALDALWPLMESVGEAAVVTRRARATPRVKPVARIAAALRERLT